MAETHVTANGTDRAYHWAMLIFAGAIITLSFVLKVRGEHQVVLPVSDVALPESCTFKKTLGIGCPGCGLTRSFIKIADGDFGGAWHFNPVGFPFFLLVVGQIPYRIAQLWRIRNNRPQWRPIRISTIIVVSLAILLIIQWLIRYLV